MSKESAIAFLKEVEIYFQKRAIMSNEDIQIQAYTQNALNINKIIKMLDNQ